MNTLKNTKFSWGANKQIQLFIKDLDFLYYIAQKNPRCVIYWQQNSINWHKVKKIKELKNLTLKTVKSGDIKKSKKKKGD